MEPRLRKGLLERPDSAINLRFVELPFEDMNHQRAGRLNGLLGKICIHHGLPELASGMDDQLSRSADVGLYVSDELQCRVVILFRFPWTAVNEESHHEEMRLFCPADTGSQDAARCGFVISSQLRITTRFHSHHCQIEPGFVHQVQHRLGKVVQRALEEETQSEIIFQDHPAEPGDSLHVVTEIFVHEANGTVPPGGKLAHLLEHVLRAPGTISGQLG